MPQKPRFSPLFVLVQKHAEYTIYFAFNHEYFLKPQLKAVEGSYIYMALRVYL